jgi:signal transduction histidine kinase/DNA-binding response OmpR family regulator
MKNKRLNGINDWVTHMVMFPGDDKETLLRKKIWFIIIAAFLLFSSGDALCNYLLKYNQVIVVDILDFSFLSLLLVIFLLHRKHIERYGLILQILLVTLPSVKTFFYGGIFHAAGVEVVALIGPIYALTFPNYRRAVLIFFYYLALALGGSVLWEYLHPEPGLMNSLYFYLVLGRFAGTVGLMFMVALIYNLQIARLKAKEQERLRQLHTAKSKFYTNITHEFRTPLTIILGIADNIKEKMAAALDKEVKMIKNSGNKLLRLVNQLLNLSKMEAGAMPVNMIQSDILPYLRYIMESFHSIAEEKNIRLHFLSKLDSLILDFDPDIIEEMVSNLLSNAIKFTLQGGDVYLQVEKENSGRNELPENLLIHIKDKGVGIAEDKLPLIFDRFYQVDDEATRKAEGSGIGLALVKEYSTLLKGNIQVKSKLNQGTEFILRLPVTQNAPVKNATWRVNKRGIDFQPKESDTNILLEESLSGDPDEENLPLVLIVEDNRDVVEYMFSILNPAYQLLVAKNGKEGIEKALETIPDIIISDVMMPERDGFEVCRVLKEDFRTNHIPIILLTAKADIDSKIAGLEQGADAYLIKPFNKKELHVRLNKLIEGRQKLKAKYSELVAKASGVVMPKGLNELFLQKTLEALDKNYHDEDYSLHQLCSDVGVSRAQLHRKLIALTGKSTTDFIRQYRIKRAKEFLAGSDLTIAEIAYQVGFKDPNYFTKSFIKENGVTPSNYRSENQTVKQ